VPAIHHRHYRLTAKLGEGGMGTGTKLNRDVVVG